MKEEGLKIERRRDYASIVRINGMWDINARHQRFSLWKGFNRTTWEVSKRFLMKKE